LPNDFWINLDDVVIGVLNERFGQDNVKIVTKVV